MSKKLTPQECFEILSNEFNLVSQAAQAKFLGLTQGRVSQIKHSKRLTKKNIVTLLRGTYKAGKKMGVSESNERLLESFEEFRGIQTQSSLAKALNKTQGAISQWKDGSRIAKNTIDAILKKSAPFTINKLVEMEEVDPGKPGGKWYFFNERTGRKREAVIKRLRGCKGVYCYFDALGYLTYVGKADETDLDKEVEARLKSHIAKERVPYRKGLKKKQSKLVQGEVVRYISAYEVWPREAISLVEALLIRATANVQFNNRLENVSN
jgi:hypothetical protein